MAAEKVTVDEAEKLIEDGIPLLDVRTEKEWKEGHIKGATRVDFYGDEFADEVAKKFKKDQPVLVYCRSGGRSARAVKVLEELGFDPVKDLDGGIIAWKKEGKEVVKPDPAKE